MFICFVTRRPPLGLATCGGHLCPHSMTPRCLPRFKGPRFSQRKETRNGIPINHPWYWKIIGDTNSCLKKTYAKQYHRSTVSLDCKQKSPGSAGGDGSSADRWSCQQVPGHSKNNENFSWPGSMWHHIGVLWNNVKRETLCEGRLILLVAL